MSKVFGFKEWVLENTGIEEEPDRSKHLAWDDEDISYEPNIDEDGPPLEAPVGTTIHNPVKFDFPLRHHNREGMRGTDLSFNEHLSHRQHDAKLSDGHRMIANAYKKTSYLVNNPLRHNKQEYANEKKLSPMQHAKHVAHLDDITNHRMKEDHVVFRGVTNNFNMSRMHTGKEFTDYGYTGTSHDHVTASAFSKKEIGGKEAVFRIRVPAGTKAYHLDHHDNAYNDEAETLLHRGTRFRVGKHYQYKDLHVTDLHIVSQGHRQEPNFNVKKPKIYD